MVWNHYYGLLVTPITQSRSAFSPLTTAAGLICIVHVLKEKQTLSRKTQISQLLLLSELYSRDWEQHFSRVILYDASHNYMYVLLCACI